MSFLTIFTPTYNRGSLLARAYDSLKAQTCLDFTWLIVDDGSEDGTGDAVERWIGEGVLDIRYIRQENGGKHTAYNTACRVTESELFFVALDSDDWLTPNAVELIRASWELADRDTAGMVFLCQNPQGKLLCSIYDREHLQHCSLQQAFVERWFSGEAEYILRTSYARQYAYPEIPGEKFCTEALVYLQMDRPFMWIDQSIYIRDYQEGGLSHSILDSYVNNPQSYRLYNRLRLNLAKGLGRRLKFAAYYGMFSLYVRHKGFLQQSGRTGYAVAALPAAFCGWLALYIRKKNKRKTCI